MSEGMQVVLAALAWFIVSLTGICYAIGGRGPKWIRRFVGGGLLAGATIALSLVKGTFSPWFLASILTLPASLTLGYGPGPRPFRRFLYGLAVSGNVWVFALPLGDAAWIVAMFQQVLGIAASMIFGLKNPFKSAAYEEAVIGGLCVALIPFVV